jgi:NAD+ synthase (glutamine-hydrolysing)
MNNGFLRVAAANPELKVADTRGNAAAIIDIIKKAAAEGVELLVFPELCITAYTCGDLFLQKPLLDGAQSALKLIAESTKNRNILVYAGLPVRAGGKLYNCAAALFGGKVIGVTPKTHLPEYGEFNELRYFASGKEVCGTVMLAGENVPFGSFTVNLRGVSVGAEICEDLWAQRAPSNSAALVTVNLSASSETAGKAEKRRSLVKSRSLRFAGAYIYADAGRGESSTDLVFSGHSIIAEEGEIIAENKPFENKPFTVADIDTEKLCFSRMRNNVIYGESENNGFCVICEESENGKNSGGDKKADLRRYVSRLPFVPECGDDEQAELILRIQAEGLMKRLKHTGAKKAVLGVSGGLDSALALLVCLRAFDGLNKPRKDLIAVSMPGFGTSDETAANALLLAKESRADYRIIDIKSSVTAHLKDIGHDLNVRDAAYENAQARMRTMILMDIANGENGIAVGTGDLSEAALGWCTYNGDHMSMYGVNSSVPKTLVKYLVKYEAERIGGKTRTALTGVLNTEISPELLPAKDGKISQKTEEIIGSFELNDFFLYHAVFEGGSPQKTLLYAAAAFGGKPEDYAEPLAKFYRRFFASQFKRSCCPDGVKATYSLSPRGDWRMPSDAGVELWLSGLCGGV